MFPNLQVKHVVIVNKHSTAKQMYNKYVLCKYTRIRRLDVTYNLHKDFDKCLIF